MQKYLENSVCIKCKNFMKISWSDGHEHGICEKGMPLTPYNYGSWVETGEVYIKECTDFQK